MPLSGTFTFVRIPADVNESIETLSGDGSGGLENDHLVQYAKSYFYQMSGAKSGVEMLEDLSPKNRQKLVGSIQEQASDIDPISNLVKPELERIGDDEMVNLVRDSQQNMTCDITAVTVPTVANGHRAVSLYAVDPMHRFDLTFNVRAVELLSACGHGVAFDAQGVPLGIYGDVFVGRAHDDEAADIWKRTHFTVEDANPLSDWCRVARSPGGGGGSGKPGNPPSLYALRGDQPQNVDAVIDGGFNNAAAVEALHRFRYGMNGAPPIREDWGSWTQTDDEVEIRLAVPLETKSKQCVVQFSPSRIKVAVAGQMIIDALTFNAIVPDESTFTLEDQPKAVGRELCVTMGKKETERIWAWVAK